MPYDKKRSFLYFLLAVEERKVAFMRYIKNLWGGGGGVAKLQSLQKMSIFSARITQDK